MQKGSSQVQDFAMSEAEVFVSSCFLLFLFFFKFQRLDPERKTQSEKNPRNLKPTSILYGIQQ